MKSIKYLLFAFVICFVALNKVSAETCTYNYTSDNQPFTYTCNVTSNSLDCSFSGVNATYKNVVNGQVINASESTTNTLEVQDFLDDDGNVNCSLVPSITVDWNVLSSNLSWEIYNIGQNVSCEANSVAEGSNNYLYSRCTAFSLAASGTGGGGGADGDSGAGRNEDDDGPEFTLDTFCTGTAQGVFTTIGWVLYFLKIAAPLILIVLGSIDFGKAVVANKDDEIKKSAKTLAMRVIAGVLIFFIPSMIDVVVELIGGEDLYDGTFTTCTHCMLEPTDDSCRRLVE